MAYSGSCPIPRERRCTIGPVISAGANSIAVFAIVFLLFSPPVSLGLIYLIWRSPYATKQKLTPAQPVPFSHAHHAGDLGIDCRMCHTQVEKAAFAGIPSTTSA